MFFDYITGVLASYFEFKKMHPNEKFFRTQKPNEENKERYSSEKNKLSLVKFITYFTFILITYWIQHVFKIKGIKTEYSDHKIISLTLISIGICIGNEVYSIFWENLSRAGYNFPKKIMKVVDVIKSSIKKIKE
jgi:phage-related holin